MALSAKVDSFQVNATHTVGTTFARSGYGFQPKALIVWTMGRDGTTDGVGTANSRRSMGFGVSTSSRCSVFTQSQDNVGDSAADTGYRTDCIIGTLTTAGAVDGLLDISSVDADGVTFVVDDQFGSHITIFVLALGGSDITDAYVGNFQYNSSSASHNITAPGFQPDCAFFLSGSWSDAIPAAFGWSQFSFGAAAGATPTNAVLWGGAEDAAPTMDTAGYCKTGECAVGVNSDVGTLDIRAYISAWLSTGFTVSYNEQGLGGSGNYYVFYLALKGGQYYLGDLLTQTDTTTDIVESGVGFQPTAVLFASACRAQSTADTCTAQDEMSIGAATSTSARHATAMIDEDAGTTSDITTANEFDAVYINLSTSNTRDGLMDVKSFDSGGFTCIMDDADPSQAFVWYVAFGSTSGGDQTITATGIASGEAFGTDRLDFTLAPSAIAGGEAFGTAQLDLALALTGIASAEAFGTSQLDLTLILTGIASGEVFGTAELQPGVVTVSPSAIASAEAFGSHQLDLTLSLSGIVTGEAFGDATLTPGAVTVSPSAIATAEAFGAPAVDLTLLASAITSLEAFGTAQLDLGLLPVGVASAEAFGTAGLDLTLIFTGIATGEAFGSASVVEAGVPQTVTPSAIATGEAFGTAAAHFELLMQAIASLEAFGSARLDFSLLPTAIASLEALGTLQLDLGLAPAGIATTEAFGTAQLDLVLVLTGIATGEAFGDATVTAPFAWQGSGTRRVIYAPGRETLAHSGRRNIRAPQRSDFEVDG